MENWSERTKEAGAKFVGSVIAENAPDDTALEECRKFDKIFLKPAKSSTESISKTGTRKKLGEDLAKEG